MKKIKVLIIVLLSIVIVFCSTLNLKAVKDLDLIEKYVVTVEPDLHDGTLKIDVELKWKVLDSSTDGPLSWIKVGVPNCYVENIKAKTANIKEIRYYDDDGAFIRIDLDKKYYKDEVVELKFSWVQTHMYFIDGNLVRYDYNPGYFNEIKVEDCIVKWKSDKVKDISESNLMPDEDDGYYIWQSSLDYGEYIKVNLIYDKMDFLDLDPKAQYSDRYVSNKSIVIAVAIIGSLTVFIIVVIIVTMAKRNPYDRERGFIVNHYHFYHHFPRHYYSSGVSKEGKPINPPVTVAGGAHSGGAGCACACACACAGGGRAGCSMKDFYHTNLQSNDVIEIIDKKK